MYTEYYGFSDRPFQLTPDARFYFDSRTHKKAMAYLGYGLAQGEGFIVITGDIGAGKSTLAAHLMATIDRSRLNVISLVSTQVEGDDMLRLAAQGMGIRTENVAKAQLLDRIEHKLEDEARSGKRTLLIVDEAQTLPDSSLEELRMLSNFQIGGRALIQIILLGQPEFRDRMASAEGLEQLRQRVIATHHLEPMGAEEIEPYIMHRLTQAGWQGRPKFDVSAFLAIYRHSDGVPRRLNQLAGRLLLYASVEQAETIDSDAVETVASDMAADAPLRREERVLPLRGASHSPAPAASAPVQPQPAPQSPFDALRDVALERTVAELRARVEEPVRDPQLERSVAALQARLEEQEAALRRVLTLLIDWVENDQGGMEYRHNAA